MCRRLNTKSCWQTSMSTGREWSLTLETFVLIKETLSCQKSLRVCVVRSRYRGKNIGSFESFPFEHINCSVYILQPDPYGGLKGWECIRTHVTYGTYLEMEVVVECIEKVMLCLARKSVLVRISIFCSRPPPKAKENGHLLLESNDKMINICQLY